jgi:hypothetical protein
VKHCAPASSYCNVCMLVRSEDIIMCLLQRMCFNQCAAAPVYNVHSCPGIQSSHPAAGSPRVLTDAEPSMHWEVCTLAGWQWCCSQCYCCVVAGPPGVYNLKGPAMIAGPQPAQDIEPHSG